MVCDVTEVGVKELRLGCRLHDHIYTLTLHMEIAPKLVVYITIYIFKAGFTYVQ